MSILKLNIIAAAVMAMITIVGCTDSTEPVAPLVVPETYDSSAYATNAVAALSLRSKIADLTTLMKTGRTPGVAVDQAALMALYAPLQENTGVYYSPYVQRYIESLARGSGKTHNWKAKPTDSDAGGVYGGYLFDEHGLEMEQMIEKGLFAACLYHQATFIMQRTVTPASVDQLLGLFGAHPSFPNTDKATVNPDRFAAAYAARRDANDGNGIYTQFKKAAIRLQAAVKAGDAYENDKNQALSSLRSAWERALMATAINYTYAAVDGLSATTVTDQARGGAMHAFGECVGFLHGWKAVSQKSRQITDAQIDELLELLRTPSEGPWTCYLFWQEPAANLTRIVQVREKLRDIYRFTESEMIGFRTNWVTAQNRQ